MGLSSSTSGCHDAVPSESQLRSPTPWPCQPDPTNSTSVIRLQCPVETAQRHARVRQDAAQRRCVRAVSGARHGAVGDRTVGWHANLPGRELGQVLCRNAGQKLTETQSGRKRLTIEEAPPSRVPARRQRKPRRARIGRHPAPHSHQSSDFGALLGSHRLGRGALAAPDRPGVRCDRSAHPANTSFRSAPQVVPPDAATSRLGESVPGG